MLRRTVTLGTAVALAAPALLRVSPAAAQGAAPPPTLPFHRTRIGGLEVTVVNDGSGWRPDATGGLVTNAQPEEIRRVLADQAISGTVLPNSWNATLVQTGGRNVLIDTGRGGANGRLAANLRAAGVDPARIDTVVITHFHGDHIGGLLTAEGVPAFPTATVVVPEREWAHWTDMAEEARAPDNRRPGFGLVRRIFAPYGGRITRFAGEAEVAPGVRAVQTPGHSPGHASYLLADGTEQLMVIGDAVTAPELFVARPDWIPSFDQDPTAAAATRRALLDRLATDRIPVVGYHWAMPGIGRIERSGAGFRLVPAAA